MPDRNDRSDDEAVAALAEHVEPKLPVAEEVWRPWVADFLVRYYAIDAKRHATGVAEPGVH